jgi:hypothetical protein
MKFTKIGLDLLLSELADLPSEWQDDEARHLVSVIPDVVERIRAIGPDIDAPALATLLADPGHLHRRRRHHGQVRLRHPLPRRAADRDRGRYEATGSKLTDFLGDILKIKQAKGYHTHLFVVTDGRGWVNRQSDLKRLLDLHQEGIVEMIYTRARLGQLGEDVRQIWTAER